MRPLRLFKNLLLRCTLHSEKISRKKWLDSPWLALTFSRSLFQASFLPASVFQFIALKTRKHPGDLDDVLGHQSI
ncbi:hypothetical protein TNCV_5110671 [Trichonephila clavipes]|nr:hypothetical protein TNCV_5110671 [Trichonephila clavipes]